MEKSEEADSAKTLNESNDGDPDIEESAPVPIAIESDGTAVYTLQTLIKHQEKKEAAMIDEMCSIFGECNDSECSYGKGYLKRQALYACHTCVPESKSDITKSVGVCLACSLHCHAGHDLVELYTKRNFRCDCGNSKFNGFVCSLQPEKATINTKNLYNHNFCGVYCTCNRPYPDPDDSIEDDMVSCMLCEDWFHTRHLDTKCPPAHLYQEMICAQCIKTHKFLLCYEGLSISVVESENKADKVNIACEDVDDPSETKKSEEKSNDVSQGNDICDNLDDISKQCEKIAACAELRATANEAISSEGSINTFVVDSMCKRPKMPREEVFTAKFYTSAEWRQNLCTCPKCKEMYAKEKCIFIVDVEDTLEFYKEFGKAAVAEARENFCKRKMNELDPYGQRVFAESVSVFRNKLRDFLDGYAAQDKVIRVEDVQKFVSDLENSRKRMKLDNDSNYNCK